MRGHGTKEQPFSPINNGASVVLQHTSSCIHPVFESVEQKQKQRTMDIFEILDIILTSAEGIVEMPKILGVCGQCSGNTNYYHYSLPVGRIGKARRVHRFSYTKSQRLTLVLNS